MHITCLLPVRNGQEDLDSYFQSVNSFADSVIALDDGSTDDTFEILSQQKIVKKIIRNPIRHSYVGWDDSLNRRKLLSACDPITDWVLWLDADEVVETSDAMRLREFVEKDANRNMAYGFEILRMVNDMKSYDKCDFWSYRLHAYKSEFCLPLDKLHFEPVPVQIDENMWFKTRLRILHRAGMTEEKRVHRYEKYLECDPNNEWQDSYDNILSPPKKLKKIQNSDLSLSVIIDNDKHLIK